MKILLARTIFFFAALFSLSVACQKTDGDFFDLTPRVVCSQGIAGTAMLHETITVNVQNVEASAVTTIKFGKEKEFTVNGSGSVSYAFSSGGTKTIKVSSTNTTIGEVSYKVYVENFESIQTVAKKLKADPNLCLVMSHRANTADKSLPENSASAVERCIKEGVHIVENDLYTTKDGHLVVSHDATVNRCTNGSGTIKNMTLAQIKNLYLKDRNGKVTTEKMLTFSEYLDLCKGRIYVNVDIGDRDANVSQVVQEVAAKGMLQQVLIYCNNAEKITAAYRTNKEANVYSWVSNASLLIDGGLKDFLYFTQCGYNTSASTINKAAAAGTIVTVNALADGSNFSSTDFTVAQATKIFKDIPSCQCLHTDVGAETLAAITGAGHTCYKME